MTKENLILIVVLSIILLILIGFVIAFCITWRVANNVFEETQVRTSKEKFKRECTWTDDKDQVRMWNIGQDFRKRFDKNVSEVQIVSENLNLFGEYFDFGYKKTIIIIPGRSETLAYSYFFAQTYEDVKVNILVIDNRSTGKSDGKYITCGIKESIDLKGWMDFLIDKKGQKEIYTHSICVGGVSPSMLLYNKTAPKEFKKAIFDGLFVDYKETFYTHMKYRGHGKFPVFYQVFHIFKKRTGCDPNLASPLTHLKNIDKEFPILFIFGKSDIFSLPEKSEILFNQCSSNKKEIVWFEKGHHSHFRINNIKEYDKVCADFLYKE